MKSSDNAHSETYVGAQRLLPTIQVSTAADLGHELAHSSLNGKIERYLLLSSPEVLPHPTD